MTMDSDGLPMPIFNNGGNFILRTMSDLGRSSMDQSEIQNIMKLGWISPIWKGVDRSDPINYCPLYTRCHLVKEIEQMIRI